METEATSHRSTEARYGGAVRWFVGQLGATVTNTTRSGGALDRHAGRTPAVRSARQRAPVVFQQAELWPAATSPAPAPAPVEPAAEEETVSFVNLKELSRPIQRPERTAIRAAVPPAPVRSSRAARNGLPPARNMALYLTASGALEGLRRDRDDHVHFDLPPRGLMTTLRAFSQGTETANPSRFPG